ncbi:DUF3617 domain-containing protein [Pseudomonas sp. 2FE]|uniref:DUF3617 domain-containing protein n=1 Tax=Pseudomonas sp. 2FE TaxID=2502190 RepID=UPI0010F4FF76|nr:DUF3617 domain-containing protein [Pseudomonas sp. 2FE]
MDIRLFTLSAAICLLAQLAQAQTLQPGLWEISPNTMQLNGQALPNLELLLGNLPAQPRQMAEQAMAQQGVAIAGQGVRVCLTAEQAKTDTIPLQGAQAGCTQQITERSAQLWKFRFSCPQGKGEGQTRFVSDREFVTTLNSTFTAGGQPQSGSLESHGRWLAAECGTLQPRQP